LQALRKERCFSLLKHVLVDQPVNISVGQSVYAVLDLLELELATGDGFFPLPNVVGLQALGFLPAVTLLARWKPQAKKGFQKRLVNGFFPDCGSLAVAGLTSAVMREGWLAFEIFLIDGQVLLQVVADAFKPLLLLRRERAASSDLGKGAVYALGGWRANRSICDRHTTCRRGRGCSKMFAMRWPMRIGI
jgi:hypothetical protein